MTHVLQLRKLLMIERIGFYVKYVVNTEIEKENALSFPICKN